MMTELELLAVNSEPRLRSGNSMAHSSRRISPWIAATMAIVSGCAVPAEDTTHVVASAEASLLCNPALMAGTEISPGVKYYNCTTPRLLFDVRAHIVTIDRTPPETDGQTGRDPV